MKVKVGEIYSTNKWKCRRCHVPLTVKIQSIEDVFGQFHNIYFNCVHCKFDLYQELEAFLLHFKLKKPQFKHFKGWKLRGSGDERISNN